MNNSGNEDNPFLVLYFVGYVLAQALALYAVNDMTYYPPKKQYLGEDCMVGSKSIQMRKVATQGGTTLDDLMVPLFNSPQQK